MSISRILFTLFLTISIVEISFSQFAVDGEFRTRAVLDHGYKTPAMENTDPVFSVSQRSRIILNYKTEKYDTRFTLQDARIWGNDDIYNKVSATGNSSSLGIFEAWINFNLSEKTGVKIGRQVWNYDDMRILSGRNWITSGLSYDGILITRNDKDNGLFFDLGLSYNNDGSNVGIGEVDNSDWYPYKTKSMNFFHVKKILGEKAAVSLMLTLSTKVDTSNNAQLGTGTHGIIFTYNKKRNVSDGVFGNLSAYYQHGTDVNRGSDGNYKKISAYLIDAELGIRALDKKLEASVGSEYISGRDYTNNDADYNNTRHSFDLAYSARYPYYGGHLNHFLIQDSYLVGTKGGAYLDPFVKLTYKLNSKNILQGGAFFPILASDVKAHTSINALTNKPAGVEVDDNGNTVYWKGSMGTYIDLGYTHKISKNIIISSGFSYGIISDIKNQMAYGYKDVSTKQLYDTGNTYFGWIMLSVKPEFFKK